jgi:DnaJ-class molecular chaperone
MDYYSIFNVSINASIEEIKNAYRNNKNKITKEAYKILKYKRNEYDKMLLEHYRSKVIQQESKDKIDLNNNVFNLPNMIGSMFGNDFSNMLNSGDKSGKFMSKQIISTTSLGKDGKYITNRSTRTKDNRGTNENHEQIQVDRDGNKIITNDGINLFKKNKLKIPRLL